MADEVMVPRPAGSSSRALSAGGTAILQETAVCGPGIKP